MKLEFSGHIFEKHPNIKFHENPFSGSRVASFGPTDRHGEANSLFAFRSFAKAPKNVSFISEISAVSCHVRCGASAALSELNCIMIQHM
jgi:hypothetical protein